MQKSPFRSINTTFCIILYHFRLLKPILNSINAYFTVFHFLTNSITSHFFRLPEKMNTFHLVTNKKVCVPFIMKWKWSISLLFILIIERKQNLLYAIFKRNANKFHFDWLDHWKCYPKVAHNKLYATEA